MVHFLGTDVHRQNTIYPKMPKILDEFKKILEEDKLEKLTITNPELVLRNEEIDISNPVEIKFNLKEKIKMRIG